MQLGMAVCVSAHKSLGCIDASNSISLAQA